MTAYQLKIVSTLLLSTSYFYTQSPLHALVIKNRGNQNWRVFDPAQGPIRTGPLNPLFIAKDYDLSGLSISAKRGDEGFAGGAMMISPHHYVTATHFNGATSFNFINRDGVQITKTTEGGRPMVTIRSDGSVVTSDLYIGKLAGDGITAADKITCHPIMMESVSQNWNWYLNKQILVCGGGSLEAGLNTITNVTDSGVSNLIGKSIFFNYSGAYTNQAGLIGESGSPWGLLWNGTYYAGGAHSGIFGSAGVDNNYTSLSSFVPAFADQIDAYIAESHPTEKIIRHTFTNTKPRITGKGNFTLLPDELSKSFNLTVDDDGLPYNNTITVTATSSHIAVLPNSSLTTTNNNGARALVVTPSPNSAGTVTVTVSANDGEFTATKDYTVTIVAPTASLPTALQNGSFESPTVTGFQVRPENTGWIFAGNSYIQSNGSAWSATDAPDGTQTAVLQLLGSISQPINLTAGTYVVKFKAAQRRSGGIQPVKISIDDNQIGSLITPSSLTFGNYTSAAFTVTTGAHMLRFEGMNGYGDNSTFIDQVMLATPVVELPSYTQSGSFETPVVFGYQYNPTGSGWDFLQSSAIHTNGSAWNAPYTENGIQAAVLQGSPAGLGVITQTMDLPSGSYAISMKAARRTTHEIQPVKVSINGIQLGSLITPTNENYEVYTSAYFTVSAGQHTLRLEATTGVSDKSTFIDNVRCFAVPAATQYIDWTGRFRTLTDAQSLPQLDPDADQISNLLEFALGLNPTKSDTVSINIQKTSSQVLAVYTRPKSLQNINYIVEYSNDMTVGSWSSTGVANVVAADDGILQTIHSTIPSPGVGNDASPKKFVRLRVESN